ncbi:hypothetical protein H0H87_006094 [Tephrocybe sp. NHM501043]|nr:hypothetical protein H0H87_006094 [Tephrocybe sp. NHM501043]
MLPVPVFYEHLQWVRNGLQIFKRTAIWKPEEMDFVTVRSENTSSILTILTSKQGIPSLEETEIPEVPPRNIWERIAGIVF